MSADETSVAASEAPRPDEQERIRNEEYKIWKKQSPFLYDVCVSKAVLSPSTSVQWYPCSPPYTAEKAGGAFDTYTLLLTSCEMLGGANTVYQAKCDLPRIDARPERFSEQTLSIISTDLVLPLGAQQFPYCARYSPVSPRDIACCGKDGFVKVFARENSEVQLKHHTRDVYKLAWSHHAAQTLATVGADGEAVVWDVTRPTAPAAVLPPAAAPAAALNNDGMNTPAALFDVDYAPLNQHELATAGDDRVIRFWDTRQPAAAAAARVITDAHATGITALKYSPLNELLLATGSADGAISIWDIRMSSASLAGLQAGTGPINVVNWSPHDESVFASGGADAQAKVWDLSLHGQAQTAAEEEEGPPELVFIHGGHLAPVTALDWHPTLPWTLASVSEDSLVEVWKVASAIVDAVDEDDEEAADDAPES